MEPMDIWRAAAVMIERHGDLAPLECALKADAFLEEGNAEGQLLWMGIRRAAAALIENQPAKTHGAAPIGYSGPYRAWGPAVDEPITPGPGRHEWYAEIAPTADGPFTKIRPHALEWWDGKAWIGTD